MDAFKEYGDVIWKIANLLWGPYRPPQYQRVMIPLTVLRRLDCVLEKNIFAEHELEEAAVVRNFRTTAADGKTYEVAHYNVQGLSAAHLIAGSKDL